MTYQSQLWLLKNITVNGDCNNHALPFHLFYLDVLLNAPCYVYEFMSIFMYYHVINLYDANILLIF